MFKHNSNMNKPKLDESIFPLWMKTSESHVVDDLFLAIQNIVAGTAIVSNTMLSETCFQYKIHMSKDFPLITLHYGMKSDENEVIHMIPIVEYKEIDENSEKDSINTKYKNYKINLNDINKHSSITVQPKIPELLSALNDVKENGNKDDKLVSFPSSQVNETQVTHCKRNNSFDSIDNYNASVGYTTSRKLNEVSLDDSVTNSLTKEQHENSEDATASKSSEKIVNIEIYKVTEKKSLNEKKNSQKDFTCEICGKSFIDSCMFSQHIKIHTDDTLLTCKECGKCFTKLRKLSRHKRNHSREKPFTCKECGKCFTRSDQLTVHKRIHSGEKRFTCVKCGKCFTKSYDLTNHKRIHESENPFVCLLCGKCFIWSSDLTNHKRIHTGEKPFKCEKCGKSFTCSRYLNRHKKIHTGAKPFTCDECGKCFTQSGDLSKHKRIHTGKKPYACEECGKSFTFSNGLKLHKRIHTGEKPFTCEECGKSFTISNSLKLHKRNHTGEKPFTCEECGKCFTRSSGLKKHKKIHTGEKSVKS